MQKSRAAITAALVAGLVLAPLATTSALAAEPIDVVLFSNSSYTDLAEEDAALSEGLVAAGGTVTAFDGGDGTVAAWTQALDGVEILAFPELAGGDLSRDLDADVVAYLIEWAENGGRIFVAHVDGLGLINALTGQEYIGGEQSWYDPFPLVIDAALPTELPDADATSTVLTDTFTSEQQAAFTAVYASEAGVAVATIALGAGQIVFFGYDWYPNTSDISSGITGIWNEVLAFFVQPPVTQPAVSALATLADPAAAPAASAELAATGADASALLVGAALLAVVGLGAIIAARRVTQRA